MSFLLHTRRYYGELHLGMPFGINLRQIVENIDSGLNYLSSRFTTFPYRSHNLRYFFHSYNAAYNNERTIEIPIARSHLKGIPASQILEIGNVLSHYHSVKHTIVDKYELAPKVINQDIIDFAPARSFRRIITISTLGHVGQDEVPKEPSKAIKAIHHLQTLLTPDGKCVVTVPVGHNHHLDRYIQSYASKNPKRVVYYHRMNSNNHWQIISSKQALYHRYGYPYPCANALAVAIFLPSLKAK